MDISPGKEWTHRIVKWSPVAALLLLSVSGFPEKKFLSSLVIRVGSRRVRNEITISVSQSCLTLCGPLDCSPPGCSVHGISQARILERAAILSLEDLPGPGIELGSPILPVDSSFVKVWLLEKKGTTLPTTSTDLFPLIVYHSNTLHIIEAQSVQFSAVAQPCLTLCDPMNRSTPRLPVHHQLPEFTQTYVHQVGDAIQPSHPLLSPFSPINGG